jgi:hypothetical protein
MMLKRIFVGLGLFALLSLSISPVLANPDTYIKNKDHTDAVTMFGITTPAEDTYTEMWTSKDKMRIDSYDENGKLTSSTIWQGSKIYFIDHAKKTYEEMDLSTDIGGIVSMMKMTVEVTPTNETQKINKWNCKKYLVKIKTSAKGVTTTMNQEVWATKDIDIDYGRYTKLAQASQAPLV